MPPHKTVLANSADRRIEEVSLVDRLVDLIRDSIITGELAPGTHLTTKKLAVLYGVSAIPVREALARLLASRLVRVENNRGYFVAERPTAEEFQHFVEARELFETAAVRLGFNKASAADIDRLRRLNEKMWKLAKKTKRNDMVAWSRLNTEFHRTLVGLARNPFIDNQYLDQSFGYMHFQLVRSYPEEFTSLKILAEQHDAMIDALIAGDKKKLLALLSDHIRNIILDD